MKHFVISGRGRSLRIAKSFISGPGKVCLFALSGGAAGGGNRKRTAYSCLKMHFRVFVKTRNSFLACFRNRIRDLSGCRFLKHARNEFRVFMETRKCILRQ